MRDKMPAMLKLWRRHEKSCPHRTKGRRHIKCSCPVWCDGHVGSTRIIQSLDTRDWARACRLLGDMEQAAEDGRSSQTVEDACSAYLESLTLESASRRKYELRIKRVREFCETQKLIIVSDMALSDLDAYRKWRNLSTLTWSKELQFLRSMFGWWHKRKWIGENIAAEMEMPKDPTGDERIPYTREEIGAILAACDTAGAEPYERLRWRAQVLLMRFYGLRVSDACTLERKRVDGSRIAVRAMKNRRWLWMPLYPEVAAALEAVPLPGGNASEYFFWSGNGKREIHVNNTIMSLASVYRESGVPGASNHRFRHTLAMELLSTGGQIEQVADMLGDSPQTIRKHYKHWMPEYQEAASRLLDKVHRPEGLRLVGKKSA